MDTLSYRGIDAWLHGQDGKHIPLGPVVVEGNQITTVVELKSPKAYHLMWCKSRDAPSINARCDIFRPAGKTGFIETARIANYYMNADDAQTQSRSSKGRLEHPLPRDSWLWTPKRRPGFVSLEIRRLQGPAKEIQRRDETGPGTNLYEMSLDYLDEIDAPPYIIFRFVFKQTVEETAGPSSGIDQEGRRTDRRVRALSAEVVVLVDSGSEDPDGGSDSTSRKQKHRAVEKTGEGSRKLGKKRSAETPSPEPDAFEALLKRRKTIIKKKEEMVEETQKKKNERKRLFKALEKDTKKQEESLAKLEREFHMTDREIEKLRAVVPLEDDEEADPEEDV